VEATQAFRDALANMTVVMTEDSRSGKELGRAKGDILMKHPVNAAMWLAQALKQDGVMLKPGDLLSLGGYIPPDPNAARYDHHRQVPRIAGRPIGHGALGMRKVAETPRIIGFLPSARRHGLRRAGARLPVSGVSPCALCPLWLAV